MSKVKVVQPKVYWIGEPMLRMSQADGLRDFLNHNGLSEFAQEIANARKQGIADGLSLCSIFAKLCYRSLTVGENRNISSVNTIENNIKGCMKHAHGSVFEHATLNFIATDVSRVATHQLVRHHAGFAFSQESGRYVRLPYLPFTECPVLNNHDDIVAPLLEKAFEVYEEIGRREGIDDEGIDRDRKKELTSSMRHILPFGHASNVGFSVNLRALRHVVMMRTSQHTEDEMRDIFGQVYCTVREEYPLIFHDAKERDVKGRLEVYGMKMQPYEKAGLA